MPSVRQVSLVVGDFLESEWDNNVRNIYIYLYLIKEDARQRN